ncbi:hypothetical protein H5410_062345 [Solanum commersonii]|uniref:Uncharacterized protein n=1 Tax=Solanum commersonii TaxID=4109 RepID=A0A9J5WA50_SOLCO|nr:hypothetical protein H5410_062345 [Solanum commersonii]
MEMIGADGQTDPFTRSNEPRSRQIPILLIFVCYSPWIFIDLSYGAGLPRRPNRPNIKVKLALEQANPPFYRFSCAIVREFFCDLEFRRHFYQKNLWTSVKTLAMDTVGPDGQTNPFSKSN